MGLVDIFTAEDRMNVTFSQFYDLIKGCTQREMMMNAVKTRVPHEYIEKMMTGKLTNSQEESVEE